MKPMYSQILEALTSREALGSFRIGEEVKHCNYLTNAVLHCYMLISVGLIRTSSHYPECGGEKAALRCVKE